MIAIIADIQGKLEKLEAFCQQLEGVPPENVYVLGDVLEYGAKMDDNICVNLVRESGWRMLLGNHEGFAVMRYFTRGVRKPEKGVIDLDEMMFQESIDYIGSLPDEIEEGDLLFTHTIPDNRNKIKTVEDAAEGFVFLAEEHPDTRICFIGHSHQPACFYDADGTYGSDEGQKITLTPGRRYIINAGALEDGNLWCRR